MISDTVNSSPEENIPQTQIVNDPSIIASLKQEESQLMPTGKNDIQPHNDDINIIPTDQIDTKAKADYSNNASSTTSHISQCKNQKELIDIGDIQPKTAQFLSKKTKRKRTKGSKASDLPCDTVTNSDMNSNNVANGAQAVDKAHNSVIDDNKHKGISATNANANTNTHVLYSESDYLKDLCAIEDNDRHSFMQKYFPSMYKQQNFYKNIKCINERRRTHREIFINKEELGSCNRDFFISEYNNDEVQSNNAMQIAPKLIQVWSVPKRDIDYEEFYSRCVQVWPFSQCYFIKEFALEYLMKHDYDMDICLSQLKDFVLFVKAKIIENNIPIIKPDVKCVKNYSLRKTKKIVYR